MTPKSALVCPTLLITADLLCSLARAGQVLDDMPVPERDRLVWDGQHWVSDNPALAASANRESGA